MQLLLEMIPRLSTAYAEPYFGRSDVRAPIAKKRAETAHGEDGFPAVGNARGFS